MKKPFKWVLRLSLLAVVLGIAAVVVAYLCRDTIIRKWVEHNIRQQTGMDASIGAFHVGIRDSVVEIEIKDIRIANPPGYGDTPLVVIPEIHAEIDRNSLINSNQIHLTLLRFNLGELDIVKNEQGQTNIFALDLAIPNKDQLQKSDAIETLKKRTGYDFAGIDLMDVSVGTFKYIDLKDPTNNRTQLVGMTNVPAPHIKSPADLAGLGVLIVLRSDNFFDPLVNQKAPDANLMKQLGF
jgi:hypothetical protein